MAGRPRCTEFRWRPSTASTRSEIRYPLPPMKRYWFALLTLVLATPWAMAGTPALPLVTRLQIPLPGRPTRFDYQTQDVPLGRLFISHMGDGTVLVFDTNTDRVMANLKGFPGDTGITAVPSINRVYVSVTGTWLRRALGEGQIEILDATTLKLIARVPAGMFPDGSAYVPALHRLYVSDEFGGTETVIDTQTNRRIATIPLGGSAGMSAYDPVSGTIFVNVQSRRRLDAINPQTDRITEQIPLPMVCEHNHGLLLYPSQRFAFIACDHNARLLAMNLSNMQVTEVHRVGREPDVLAMDLPRKRLYVASESGVVSVFHITRDGLRKLGQGYVGDDAHSIAVDPATGLVYLPIEDFHGKPVLKIMRYQITGSTGGK